MSDDFVYYGGFTVFTTGTAVVSTGGSGFSGDWEYWGGFTIFSPLGQAPAPPVITVPSTQKSLGGWIGLELTAWRYQHAKGNRQRITPDIVW